MGGRPEYRVKKWGPYLEKQKMQLFLHFIKIRKISKGGTLGLKKIQSSPIWTKLAGLVGTIKKISWEVILKFACTLLGCERPKTKNDAKGVPLEQKKIQSAPIWTKLAGLVGGIKKMSWVVILKCSCTLLRSEGSKKKVFVTKSGGFWRKKPPKVEDWKSILNEILTFEKKTTKSGGFSSFDKKTPKDKGFSSFRN